MKLKELRENIVISGKIQLWLKKENQIRPYPIPTRNVYHSSLYFSHCCYTEYLYADDELIKAYDDYEVVEINSESDKCDGEWINIYLREPKG